MMYSVTWECPVPLTLTFNFDAAKGALKEVVLEPIVQSSITLNAFFPLSVVIMGEFSPGCRLLPNS